MDVQTHPNRGEHEEDKIPKNPAQAIAQPLSAVHCPLSAPWTLPAADLPIDNWIPLIYPVKISEETRKRKKPTINTGVIGHVDHRKKTLTAAMPIVLPKTYGGSTRAFDRFDSVPEVDTRGIIIKTAHVEYGTPARRYEHAVWPSHADRVRCMITGALPMDGVILVESAADGPMPQVRICSYTLSL